MTCTAFPNSLAFFRLETPIHAHLGLVSERLTPAGPSLGAITVWCLPQLICPVCAPPIASNTLTDMNGRQLLALGARLQQAVGSGGGGLVAAEAAGSAWLPAQQQLLSLKAWTSGISTGSFVAGSTSGAGCSAAAAAARRQAGVVGRRGFAADASAAAVARPGPAPRGTSRAGAPHWQCHNSCATLPADVFLHSRLLRLRADPTGPPPPLALR